MWAGYYKGTTEQINEDVVAMREEFKNHVYDLHTSGHATRKDLSKMCSIIQPRIAIIPIHKDPNTDFRTLDISQELENRVYTESTEVEGIEIKYK